MKKTVTLVILLILQISNLFSQNQEHRVDRKDPVLFEKLYLHVDRELYAPGDKIWLKVYQVNGATHQLNSNFRNVYVQLISEEGKVVRDINLLTIKGIADGEIQTDGLPKGIYTIRAFTRYLENFGEKALFHKKVWIANPAELAQMSQETQENTDSVDVSFLPEGGNLVVHAFNTVAFKAIDEKGKGIYVSGKILNASGDTVSAFSVSYRGMGKFHLMPDEGTDYYAAIDQFPGRKFWLPKALPEGIGLNCEPEDESLIIKISTNMQLQKFPEIYVSASHKGLVLFQKRVEMTSYLQIVKVNKNLFPAGISKITVTDPDMNPLAERLVFAHDSIGDLLHLQVNQKIFGLRQEVKIDVGAHLQPEDSINSDISVAVVNKNYLSTGEYSQNIKSYLLLDSELKGGIESPAAFFSDDEFHSSAEKLDLLMMVNGWRSYIWEDILKAPVPSVDDWNDAGINLSGYVKRILWKEPLEGAEVSLDYVFKDFQIGKTTTDHAGRFHFDRIYLVDSMDVMLNARTKNGTRNAEILLDPLPERDSQISIQKLNENCPTVELNPNFIHGDYFRRMKELDFTPDKETILLDEIEIIDKKAGRAINRSFGEYVWADKTFVIHPADYTYRYVIDYLQYKLPSFVVSADEVMLGTNPVNFMLDAVVIDQFEFKTIRMQDVEFIDILYPGFRKGFYTGSLGVVDPGGLIAIYQKKPFVPTLDYSFSKGRIRPELKGYHRSVAFYSPKYTPENIDSPRPDFRPTLYWNPKLDFERGEAKIQFFTSDEMADYLVIVEGISKNGQICFGTASFSVDKK